jgi:hypothetical protein
MTRIMFLLGVIFTVLSIFISYYVINKNQGKIDNIRTQISVHENGINQLWKKQQDLEQRHATSLILYALVVDRDKKDPVRVVADSYVAETMEYYDVVNTIEADDNPIKLVPKKLKQIQSKTIDNINDLFAEKLILGSSMMDMQKTNEIYKVIGLLMQVIGLVLVLYFKRE